MANPYAIQIHCDGAMNYDTRQTGGNGFFIEFPDSLNIEPISRSLRNDGQGIHRLEMISLIKAMEELLCFAKTNPALIRRASGVELYTDRLRVTDGELTNRFRIKEWRRNGWKNHENKPIKDKDLLDKIDKTRTKLAQVVGGSVSINYEREKSNKIADKLSKAGKNSELKDKKLIEKKKRRVIRRKYSGVNVDYSLLNIDYTLDVRVYAWEPVGDQFEICFEVCEGVFLGKTLKAYVNLQQKSDLHRGHYYSIIITYVFKHHIKIKIIKELEIK